MTLDSGLLLWATLYVETILYLKYSDLTHVIKSSRHFGGLHNETERRNLKLMRRLFAHRILGLVTNSIHSSCKHA